MSYKLVALDIDGTLLNSKHELVDENIFVVRKLVAQGVKFVLVTGRPDVMVSAYAKQLHIDPIILGYNGATIRDLASKEIFQAHFIASPLVQKICSILNPTGIYYRVYCMDCVYSFNDWEFDPHKNPYAHFSKNLEQAMGFKVLRNLDELKEPVVKVVAFSENPEKLNNIRALFKDIEHLNVVFGSKNGLDINASSVNKGTALLNYAKKHHIDAAEIIAIGDSENDLSMLEVVGMPVTLENGSDLLKKYAKFITKSNDAAGVAYALKSLFPEKF